jgi:5-formyltetrahydrofolate cyclo-ligase
MAVPSPIFSDKSHARAEGLRLRRDCAAGLDPKARAAQEMALAHRVAPHLAEARVIAAYHPLNSEIGVGAILDRLGRGQRVAFPWFADREAALVWREGPATGPGPWGMGQPAADAPVLEPDIVLVPIVLADRFGTRIGHGQGHYDRALERLRAGGPIMTIGLGWACQLDPGPLPADPWDVPLDAVATPEGWFPCA